MKCQTSDQLCMHTEHLGLLYHKSLHPCGDTWRCSARLQFWVRCFAFLKILHKFFEGLKSGELTARSNTGSCFGALRPKRKRKLASLLTLDLIEHTGPTTTGTIKQTNPSDCGNIKDFSLCLSILAPDLDLQIKCKLYFNEKRTVQIFFSSGQAKTLLMWSQAQEYLECDRCASCPKDVCVAALYGTTSPFVKFYRS